jgi:hypothetical protein
MSVASDLTWCQEFLHDVETPGDDGILWTRRELLDWYIDGYRQLVAASQSRRWSILNVPPRWTITGTFPWEARLSQGGTFLPWTFHGQQYATTALFELELVEGYTPTVGSEGISQGWERQFINPTYTPFRFGLRRDHAAIVRMWYDHRLLLPVTTRELDSTFRQWTSLGNYPLAWTTGTGDDRTFEVYEIQTVESNDYEHIWDDVRWSGIVREMSGDRTYTVENAPDTSIAVGMPREMFSPDRQYWPVSERADQQMLGKVDRFASDEQSLLVLENIGPDSIELDETDSAGLVPQQMHKYLRYYTLARALGRQGEGENQEMSSFFVFWFELGKKFMPVMQMLARRDAQWARQPSVSRSRPPRPHLPSHYPYVRI